MLTPFPTNPRAEMSRVIQLLGGPFHGEQAEIWDATIRIQFCKRPLGGSEVQQAVYRLLENGKWAFDAAETEIVKRGGHAEPQTIHYDGIDGMTLGRFRGNEYRLPK